MKRVLSRLRRDRRGVSAIEFAIVAPVLILMVIGILQMGAMFYAQATLQSAVADGARFATIFPRPTRAQVVARIEANRTSAINGTFGAPQVAFALNPQTRGWVATVTMTYTASFDFIFFATTRTFTYTRQANIPPPPT
ncbi:MAG TPA: TadE/TadG family type IV pilus assembly protein [Allosphingosinicella sp.]|nr:TadE/TadG family type IV pilus assembly protein [Allosphingosinicella sp.]